MGRGGRARVAGRAAACARGGRDQGADERGGGADGAVLRGHRARDLVGRVDVHEREAGRGGDRSRAAAATRCASCRGSRDSSREGCGRVRGRARRTGGRCSGAVPGIEGLAIASGHGAWGITLGPASARLVADQLLGRPAEIPPAFAPGRASSSGWSRAARWGSSCPRSSRPSWWTSSSSYRTWCRWTAVLARRVLDAEDLAVLAGAVDVVLAVVALDEHEGVAVALVAARVQVHARARAVEDVGVAAAGDVLGLLGARRPCRTSRRRSLGVGGVVRGGRRRRTCPPPTLTTLRSAPVP